MTPAGRRRRLLRSLALSVRLLAAHRRRTALSVSGLLVGVAAVIVMSAVGAGAERRVVDRVRALGTDLLVVNAAPARPVAGRVRQVATHTMLRPADAQAIVEESALARRAAAAVTRPLVLRREGRNATVTVLGTTPDGLGIRGFSARSGRLFDEPESRAQRRVAVIGPTVARNLYPGQDPIGSELRIGNVPFDVIGVTRPRGTDVANNDLDNVVLIPLETAMRRLLNVPYVNALLVQARSSADLDALQQEAREILYRRHRVRAGAPEPFLFQNQAALLRIERGAARELQRLTVGVAAVALVVGGIGILAVMLMAVRERVREIGLRRALGARRKDIQVQFLLEAAMLAAAGGTAGVLLGVVAAGVLALLGPWDLALTWRPAAMGLMTSAALGLAAGLVPAARAARLEPVEALRA